MIATSNSASRIEIIRTLKRCLLTFTLVVASGIGTWAILTYLSRDILSDVEHLYIAGATAFFLQNVFWGFIQPRQPWLWGIASASGVPFLGILGMAVSGSFHWGAILWAVMFVVLAIACVLASYFGAFFRVHGVGDFAPSDVNWGPLEWTVGKIATFFSNS